MSDNHFRDDRSWCWRSQPPDGRSPQRSFREASQASDEYAYSQPEDSGALHHHGFHPPAPQSFRIPGACDRTDRISNDPARMYSQTFSTRADHGEMEPPSRQFLSSPAPPPLGDYYGMVFDFTDADNSRCYAPPIAPPHHEGPVASYPPSEHPWSPENTRGAFPNVPLNIEVRGHDDAFGRGQSSASADNTSEFTWNLTDDQEPSTGESSHCHDTLGDSVSTIRPSQENGNVHAYDGSMQHGPNMRTNGRRQSHLGLNADLQPYSPGSGVTDSPLTNFGTQGIPASTAQGPMYSNGLLVFGRMVSSPAPSNTQSDRTEWTCPEPDCDAKFSGKYGKGNLGRHRRHAHGGQGGSREEIRCGEGDCDKVFRRKDARLKHWRNEHPERGEKPMVPRKVS